MPEENQMNQHFDYRPARLVVFTGGTHRPSKSRALGEFIAAQVGMHVPVEVEQFDIIDAGHGLGAAFARKELTPEAALVLEAVENADALIAITPVYKGSFTGLFKHLIDFVEPNALLGKPVLIGATGEDIATPSSSNISSGRCSGFSPLRPRPRPSMPATASSPTASQAMQRCLAASIRRRCNWRT
jgi:multimeric flavodoxin WrbA